MYLFISMVLFYDYKFSKMVIEKKCLSFIHMVLFYDYKISKIGISKILKSFIHMVLFYDYKFSKIGIQGNESFSFAWNLKDCL